MRNQVFYSFNLEYFQDAQLAEQLLPVARKFLSEDDKLTNEWGYKNTYTNDYGLSTDPDLKVFVDLILKNAEKFLDKQGIRLKKNLKLWVSLFASEMTKNDEHTSHCHSGALLSGLIYLKVPPNSARLEFISPRYRNTAWTNCLDETSYSNATELFKVKSNHIIEVQPVEGLFLLWESWALHRVPVNPTDSRITLVFNVGAE